MIRKLWPGLLCNAAAAIFAFAVWDRLPERMATHFGFRGQANGWSSRTTFVILMPALTLLIAFILVIAPRLDPKRRNFPLHANAYWAVVNGALVLFALMDVMLIGYNIGWRINLGMIIGVGMGALFVLIGNLLTRVRPNWIFGVRTPWTLSSDRAWRETHRVAGYLFVATGLTDMLMALVWPRAVYAVLIGGGAIAAVVSVVWSYFAWKRDPEAQGREP